MSNRSGTLLKTQRNSTESAGQFSPPRAGALPAVRSNLRGNDRELPVPSRTCALIPASLRHDMIRDAAYFRAEARGFVAGMELQDWLTAEQDVEDLIRRRYGGA
jgi:hypothetical protein